MEYWIECYISLAIGLVGGLIAGLMHGHRKSYKAGFDRAEAIWKPVVEDMSVKLSWACDVVTEMHNAKTQQAPPCDEA